jgi:NitT/TauT family transport system substrate-binding protein
MRVTLIIPSVLILTWLMASWSAAAERVKVATPAQGLIELPIVVATRNGYFQTEGLEIQKIQIAPEVAVKALVAGEVDFSLAWEASLRAALSGAPVKAVAALVARPLHAFISRPEIRSGGDLAGKVVGIDASSSTIDFLSQVAARYLGAGFNKSVGIVEIGHSELRLTALREGEIHATAMDIASAAKAEDEGFKRFFYFGDILEMPVSGVFVTRAALSNQPERIKRFLRATLRAAHFIRHERADTVRILQHHLKITPSQATRSYDAAIRAFARDGIIPDRLLAFSARRAGEELQLANTPALGQLADWSLLREILAERRKVPFWLKLKPYDF